MIFFTDFFDDPLFNYFSTVFKSMSICSGYKIILIAYNKRENYDHLLCHGDGFHFNGPHLTVILLSSLSVFLLPDLAFTASQIII